MIRCAAVLLVLALAGCKGGDKPAEDAKAMGEVLPGSASDAMIPLDTVRSQPPLAPPTSGAARHGAAKRGNDAAADASDAPSEGEDAPAVAVPAPAASANP